MLKRYATKEEITNALCEYQKGDVITLLEDKSVNNGVIASGSRLGIRRIEPRCDYKIFVNELGLYEKNNNNFIYYVFDSECSDEFLLFSEDFVKEKLSTEEIQKILDARRKKKIKPLIDVLLAGIFLALFYGLSVWILSLIQMDFVEILSLSVVPAVVLTTVSLGFVIQQEEKDKYSFEKKTCIEETVWYKKVVSVIQEFFAGNV